MRRVHGEAKSYFGIGVINDVVGTLLAAPGLISYIYFRARQAAPLRITNEFPETIMTFDPDFHHRRSVRLKEYDYSSCGAYFMTICVQGRESLFGEIVDGGMRLNDAGQLIATVWHELPGRFPHVSLDEFVVMPNHVHGIILLDDRRDEPCVRPVYHHHDNAGEHKVRPYGTAVFSLGRVCQAFKSLTTVEYGRGVNDHNWPPFAGRLWQRNYYERVIRDEKELAAVREYIHHNPSKWEYDGENPANHM